MISSLLATDVLCLPHFMIAHGRMLHQLFLPPNFLRLLWVVLPTLLPQNRGCHAPHMVVRVYTNRDRYPLVLAGAKVWVRDRHHQRVLLVRRFWITSLDKTGLVPLLVRVLGHIINNTTAMDMGLRRGISCQLVVTFRVLRVLCRQALWQENEV